MANERCSLLFAEAHAPDPTEIAEFLFLFRATYAAAVRMVNDQIKATAEGAEQLAVTSRDYLASLGIRQIDRLFYSELGQQQLLSERISHESPLEFVFEGIAIAMAAAIIISGGKFKTPLFEAEMPALGDGIKRLRAALAPGPKIRLGFGFRSRKIKLSKLELALLFQLDRNQRNRGGFQRFIVGLQDKTNRQTGILELSEADQDFILRHGREAHKGGFQARIRKTFDRHFNFD